MAAPSRHFLLIPKTPFCSKRVTVRHCRPCLQQSVYCLIAVPCSVTFVSFTSYCCCSADITPHYVAGHVLMGLTVICAFVLLALSRHYCCPHQTRNTFLSERTLAVVRAIGLFCLAHLPHYYFCIHVLISSDASVSIAPGIPFALG